MKGWIWHQHEMRDVRRRESRYLCRQIVVGPDVAAHDDECVGAEQRQRAMNATAGLERDFALVAVLEAHAETRAISQCFANLRALPREVDHDLPHATARER